KIDPADTHPTGITINPANVSDIWIVDSGTDKVYQYVGAASRTSGSQNAAATFALAAGDTNPQGIADPPPADMLLVSTEWSVAAPNAASFAGASAVTGVPSLAGRDAAFAELARQPLPGLGASLDALLTSEALTPAVDNPVSVADHGWTPAGISDGATT